MNSKHVTSLGLLLASGLTAASVMAASGVSADDVTDELSPRSEAFKARAEERKAMHEGIDREVTLTDTGVTITLTSDDAEIAQKLIERETEPQKLVRTVTTLDNGVQITLSTDDPDLLEKLHSEKGVEGGFGPGFPGGRHHFKMFGPGFEPSEVPTQ